MSLLIPYWLLQVIRHLSAQHRQLEVVVVVGGGNDIDHRRGQYRVTTKMSSIFCPKRKCPGTVLSSNDFVQFRTSHFAPFEFTMLVNLYFALRTSHLTPQLQEEKKVLFLLFALRASRILSFSLFDAYFSIFCLTRFFNERE